MRRNYRISQILFISSLCLLAVFELVWLKTVFKDKKEELENQIDFLWIKEVNELDQLKFIKQVQTLLETKEDKDSSTYNIQYKVSVDDSSYTAGRAFNFSKIIEIDDTGSTKSLSQDYTNLEKSEVYGELFSFWRDSLKINQTLLEENFRSKLKEEQIALLFEIKVFDKEEETGKLVQDRIYKQPMTGKKYYINIHGYNWYILSAIWFEVLMAILLLLGIGVAFFYILNSLRKQQQLMQLKNDLISNITHELRTPIFTVSAALEALENFNAMDDPERSKEYLQISKAELKRLSILVEKVLKTSMFDEPVSELKLETFDLVQLVQGIQNSMQLLFEQKQATFHFQAASPAISITADKVHLTNVIYNLIDNALKYNNQAPNIELRVKEDEQQIQLELEDNGIGIDKSYQDKVFERFFRVPTGNQHNVKGYGLGLNYVAGVVQKHNGTISLSSKPDQGSTFTIRLPKGK